MEAIVVERWPVNVIANTKVVTVNVTVVAETAEMSNLEVVAVNMMMSKLISVTHSLNEIVNQVKALTRIGSSC